MGATSPVCLVKGCIDAPCSVPPILILTATGFMPVAFHASYESLDCILQSLHRGGQQHLTISQLLYRDTVLFDDTPQPAESFPQSLEIQFHAVQNLSLDDLVVPQVPHGLLHFLKGHGFASIRISNGMDVARLRVNLSPLDLAKCFGYLFLPL